MGSTTATIRANLGFPSVRLAAFVLSVCSAVCSLGSCCSAPDRPDCASDSGEFDERVARVVRHCHCCVAESGIGRIGSHRSRQRRRPIVASATASLASEEALDWVHIRMALRPRWQRLAAERRRNSDRHRQPRTAKQMSVVDVCPSCDDSGTKPVTEKNQTNEFNKTKNRR